MKSPPAKGGGAFFFTDRYLITIIFLVALNSPALSW